MDVRYAKVSKYSLSVALYPSTVVSILWDMYSYSLIIASLTLERLNIGIAHTYIGNREGAVPFWILHISLLAYVYGVGSVVYQWKFAEDPVDFIKSFINISLLILIFNNSLWFLIKRSDLKLVLKDIQLNDELSRGCDSSRNKHKALLTIIKRIIIGFYIFNYLDAMFIYLPNRTNVMNDYALTPCVGLGPLTLTPYKEICMVILGVQECTIMIVVLNYQTLIIFLIGHSAVMYQILADEMMAFNNYDNLKAHQDLVKQTLPSLIKRHSLTLGVIDKLKSLYSLSLGVNFGSHAVCILLLLYLPIPEWFVFIPISVYCCLVFFLYCFLCQMLVNSSEEFEKAVYCCGWENFDLKEQKMISVMLRQAQKPVEILAADIIPVNIYTFATTLQAIYKFITVVKI